MARAPVLAAGGIVLRPESPPRIAVVRLRKRNEWVLPKGKLDDGETPRDAAEREVLEETGHEVRVHEFLGTLVYESGGRSKVVHYWRMEANGGQVYELTSDVREVDWLPLEAALERLSRGYEQAFLANVAPYALEAAARAAPVRPAARPQAARKRRSRPVVEPPAAPAPAEPLPPAAPGAVELESPAESPLVADDVVPAGTDAEPIDAALTMSSSEMDPPPGATAEAEQELAAPEAERRRPRSLAQLVRDWLRRAA